MSKHDEKALLARFITGLPAASYLRDILAPLQGEIASAIDCDFGFVDWHVRLAQQREQEQRLREMQEREEAVRMEVRQLERQAERLREGLAALRSEARRMAG